MIRFASFVLALSCGIAPSEAAPFYKEPTLFSVAPDETVSFNTLARFGPVGMVIESINGEMPKDIDPRIQLGDLIAKAEATDGTLTFAIRDQAAPVVVKIPVLGAYSKTWPLDCPKSEKIIRGFADYISKPESHKSFADAGMLFLLSTGDEKNLAPVNGWVQGLAAPSGHLPVWTESAQLSPIALKAAAALKP